jgi:sulfatase modifying factor 1
MKKTNVVLVVALLALQTGVQAETKSQENPGIEVLEDGNVRDPAPTPEQIASLVARTKKIGGPRLIRKACHSMAIRSRNRCIR